MAKATDSDYFKSILLANEFLKLLHGLLNENLREDPLPPELQESLANEHLKNTIEKYDIEPEALVWGLVKIVEMLLVTNNINPTDLSQGIDRFVALVESDPNLEIKEMGHDE
jgi:hypothetical protein